MEMKSLGKMVKDNFVIG